ncbi:hypothetical protein CENSYa_1435 [Cenarchaeum symbiosum A]|uniref:Uncharacterized protein n=1 Tax=Cenarchaeum symbiosum (strain A) TaxID=414004 RepID=A0RXJ0_CENSY|nr:hypothetical protein CENSYa_1435 [Cenarchaeum symbiosum A]
MAAPASGASNSKLLHTLSGFFSTRVKKTAARLSAMRNSRKAIIIALVAGLGIFGYTQYASATQIGVVITESRLVAEGADGSTYDLMLEFENPSLLVLTAGETEFTLTADDRRIGDGTLEPFVLSAMDSTEVSGTFLIEDEDEYEGDPEVRINGVTRYDALFTSIDVPFVYYPTAEQARGFIHTS